MAAPTDAWNTAALEALDTACGSQTLSATTTTDDEVLDVISKTLGTPEGPANIISAVTHGSTHLKAMAIKMGLENCDSPRVRNNILRTALKDDNSLVIQPALEFLINFNGVPRDMAVGLVNDVHSLVRHPNATISSQACDVLDKFIGQRSNLEVYERTRAIQRSINAPRGERYDPDAPRKIPVLDDQQHHPLNEHGDRADKDELNRQPQSTSQKGLRQIARDQRRQTSISSVQELLSLGRSVLRPLVRTSPQPAAGSRTTPTPYPYRSRRVFPSSNNNGSKGPTGGH